MKKVGISVVVSAALGIVAALTAQWTSTPWCDELVVTDSAVNFLRTGVWQSNVWPCCYNPLHSLVAAAAIALFGASHQVVASLGCVLAFLASLVILRAMRRRNALRGPFAETLFVLLFWSGWYFAPIVVNGRPDMLTLLLVAWLLDEVFPAEGATWRGGWIALKGALLMLTSIYAIPFCVLLSAFPFLFRSVRRDAFLRTLFLGLGLAAGGIVVVAFYAWQRELVRFVGWLTFFNTITGECTQSLGTRLAAGYLHDPQALVMLAAATLLAPFTPLCHSARFWRWTALVASVPAIMVFCGRFQPYYAWLFFVPACMLFAAVASRMHRAVGVALAAAAVVGFVARPELARRTSQPRLDREARVSAFVAAHADVLGRGETVLVADDILHDTAFYYPLLKRGVDLWFRGKDTLEAPSDREKFEKGLAMFLSDPAKRGEILAQVFRFQHVVPVMPERAVVIFISPENRRSVQPVIERLGFEFGDIASEGGFSLCRCRAVQKSEICR